MTEPTPQRADITFDVVSLGDGTVVVTIKGELDMNTIAALEAAVEPAINRRPPRLVVDVSGIEFADSSAIACG
jgi:anti-sigma B factor antagonist